MENIILRATEVAVIVAAGAIAIHGVPSLAAGYLAMTAVLRKLHNLTHA